MSLLRPATVLAALFALGATTAAAQSRVPASIWGIPLPDRDGRRESRDADSDSDSDSDWDSDSDSGSRRGGIFDRVGRGDRSPQRRGRDVRLDREIDRVHDEWHRRNDRDRRDRDWQRRHAEMHAQLERARRQQADRSRGVTW